jgi:uncharacterized membrane protein
MGQIGIAVSVISFIIPPLLAHFIITYGNPDSRAFGMAGAALLLCQGFVVSILIGARLRPPLKVPAITLVMAASVGLCVSYLRGGLVLSSGSPHALIYFILLIAFGQSLLPGREPIVTYFARTIHGDIAPEIMDYTRRVTWAWCCFFGLELLGSAILLTLAPIAWWSSFVNILNLPLLAAMLLGERLTRPFWVANPPHEDFNDFLRIPKFLKLRLQGARPEAS